MASWCLIAFTSKCAWKSRTGLPLNLLSVLMAWCCSVLWGCWSDRGWWMPHSFNCQPIQQFQQLGADTKALQLLYEVQAASFTSAFEDQSYLKQMIESRYLYSPMMTTSSPLVTGGSLLKSTSSSFILETLWRRWLSLHQPTNFSMAQQH